MGAGLAKRARNVLLIAFAWVIEPGVSVLVKPGAKYEGVQALRFIAALLVVCTHSTLYASDRLDPSMNVWHFGEVGVDIFFTISGFVMVLSTGRLVKRAEGWKYFGMRRLVRIVPMYWIATTVKVLMLLVLPGAALYSQLNAGHALSSFLFIPAWSSEGRLEPLLGVGWTLVFEMFFYAVFTLALLLRASPLWFCASIMTACTIGSLFRPTEDFPAVMFYLNPIVLYFVVGMVIGRWAQDRNTRNATLWLGVIFIIWIAVAITRNGGDIMVVLPTITRYVGVTALLFILVAFEPHLRWLPKPLTFLGDSSYSLYLCHPLIAPVVPVALGIIGIRIGWLSVVGSVLVAIIGSAIIYQFVERPVTRYLQRKLPYVKPHAAGTIEPSPAATPMLR